MSPELRDYLRDRIIANNERIDSTRGGRNHIPSSQGLPQFLSPDLPQVEGFIKAERMPGSKLAVDVNSIELAGLKVSDVFEDEEWVRLPDNGVIRREIKSAPRGLGSYEVWHYPPKTRILHVIYVKNPKRLFEIRLSKKSGDEANGSDGPWAFGLYRPVREQAQLELYTLRDGRAPEEPVVSFNAGGTPHRIRISRMEPESCRACHITRGHGDGWYQYSDVDHAGPCGFVPSNKSILADWAVRYQARYRYFPFTGP